MLTWLTGHYCSLGVGLFLFLEIENDTCVSTVSVFAMRIKCLLLFLEALSSQ